MAESKNNPVTHAATNGSANNQFKNMTFGEKCAYIKTVITVEPLIAFYFIPTLICYPALYTLELEKACRVNLGYDDEICDGIIEGTAENYTNESNRVQQEIAGMHSWQNPMQNFVPLILILFLASYSDRHKIRKPFLLIPIVGEFFAITGCILCVVFMRELPLEVQGFSQTVLPSFFGGSATLTIAVFAYISDISSTEMRTLRIGIIQIVLIICSLLSALGGYLFTVIGYYGVFAIGGVMYFTAFCYGLIHIKEDRKRPKYENAKSFLQDVFDPFHAIATLKLLVPSDATVKYLQLLLVLSIYFISALVLYGEATVFWLFAINTYGYTPVDYSYFDSIKNGIMVIGSLVFLPLFTKVFKFHDATIIIVTFLDKVASNILLILFVNEFGLYASTVVSNCHAIGNTALRSLLTKSVQVKDLAKALSLMSLVDTLANTAASPIYNTIYSAIVNDYAKGFLFLAIVLFSLCALVITVTYCCSSRVFTKDEEEPKKKDEPIQTKQALPSQTTKL